MIYPKQSKPQQKDKIKNTETAFLCNMFLIYKFYFRFSTNKPYNLHPLTNSVIFSVF
jgi:hypothetical protein